MCVSSWSAPRSWPRHGNAQHGGDFQGCCEAAPVTLSTPSPGTSRRYCNPRAGRVLETSAHARLQQPAHPPLERLRAPVPTLAPPGCVRYTCGRRRWCIPGQWSRPGNQFPCGPLLPAVPPCKPAEEQVCPRPRLRDTPRKVARTQNQDPTGQPCRYPTSSRLQTAGLCVAPFGAPAPQLSGRSLLNSSGPQGVVPASCSSRTAVGRQRREGRAPLSAGGCSPCFAPSLPRGPGRTTLPSQLPPAPPAPGLDSPDLQNSLWPRGQAHFFLQNSAITLQMLPEKQVLTPDGVVGR